MDYNFPTIKNLKELEHLVGQASVTPDNQYILAYIKQRILATINSGFDIQKLEKKAPIDSSLHIMD